MLCSWDVPSVLTDLFTPLASCKESIIPIARFHQPELKFFHDVGSSSVCTINVPNDDESGPLGHVLGLT